MKTINRFSIYLFVFLFLFHPNLHAQDSTTSNLPDGAKLRIGKGTLEEIAYFPDGTRFAVASSVGVRIYDSITGKELNQLTENTYRSTALNSIRFSPDGKTFITEGPNGSALLWDTSTENLIAVFSDEKSRIYKTIYSPGGTVIATLETNDFYDFDTIIKFWDGKTGELLQKLTEPDGHFITRFGGAAFVPDNKSKILAYWSLHELVLWDIDSGQSIRTIKIPEDSVIRKVRFSPDGSKVATSWGGYDESLELWDVATGQHLKSIKEADESNKHSVINDIVFSYESGKLFILRGKRNSWNENDKTVSLWDINPKDEKRFEKSTHYFEEEAFSSISFSPNGKILATEDRSEGVVYLWDTTTGDFKRIHTEQSQNSVTTMTFSQNGKILATGATNGTIHLWSTNTGKKLQKLIGHTERVNAISFSSDGLTLLSKGQDNTVRLWDSITGQLLKTIAEYTYSIIDLTFSPDGNSLVSADSEGRLNLWDTITGQNLTTLAGHEGRVNNVSFSPDGMTIASGNSDYTITIWDNNTGDLIKTFTGHENNVSDVYFSSDGQTILSHGSDHTVRFWDVKTGENKKTLSGLYGIISFSPDRQTIAVGISGATEGDPAKLSIYDIVTEQDKRIITATTDGFSAICFSPDGDAVATACGNSSVVDILNINTGQVMHSFSGHASLPYCGGGTVDAISFSPDGNTLATGSVVDNTVLLSSTVTGQNVKTLSGHSGGVSSVVFSPDGKTLASGSGDGTILLWEIQ